MLKLSGATYINEEKILFFDYEAGRLQLEGMEKEISLSKTEGEVLKKHLSLHDRLTQVANQKLAKKLDEVENPDSEAVERLLRMLDEMSPMKRR
jgi:hypothetical protein